MKRIHDLLCQIQSKDQGFTEKNVSCLQVSNGVRDYLFATMGSEHEHEVELNTLEVKPESEEEERERNSSTASHEPEVDPEDEERNFLFDLLHPEKFVNFKRKVIKTVLLCTWREETTDSFPVASIGVLIVIGIIVNISRQKTVQKDWDLTTTSSIHFNLDSCVLSFVNGDDYGNGRVVVHTEPSKDVEVTVDSNTVTVKVSN